MINVTSFPWTFKWLQTHDFVTFGLRHMAHLRKFRRWRMLPGKYNFKINPEDFTSPQLRSSLVFSVTNGMPWSYRDLPSACLTSHWLICSLLRGCIHMLEMVWLLQKLKLSKMKRGSCWGRRTGWGRGREVWLHSNRNRKFLQSHQEPWPLLHWPRLSFSGCLFPTSSLSAVWLSLLFPAQRGRLPSGLRVSSPSLFRQDDSPEFSVPGTF